MGQEGGAPAEIGDWTDVCLLFFEAGTHVSERVWQESEPRVWGKVGLGAKPQKMTMM